MVSSIAVFSGKGGVGKSTLSAALAQISGATLVDCDPQLTASDWGDRRETPPSVLVSQLGRVPALVKENPKLVVDTPGALVGNVSVALGSVDLVLLVTGDRQPEIDALPSSLATARQAGAPIVCVINRVHPSSDPSALVSFIRDDLGVAVAPVVRERAAHYRAWSLGLTAIEHEPDGTAAAEIRGLWDWLCNRGN